jgi:hypothetical protein
MVAIVVGAACHGPPRPGPGEPPPTPATEGTATGSLRPGLTRAGLVSLEDLGDARLWLGLVDGDDRRAGVDVRVELLRDGETVATGLSRCVTGLSGDARRATEVAVPWAAFDAPTLEVGDVLGLRVSTRLGTNAGGGRCGNDRQGGRPSSVDGVRLFYGAVNRDSGVAATITPDPSVELYAASDAPACGRRGRGEPDLTLSEQAPAGDRARCEDSGRLRASGGNRWSEVGTWDLPPQCDCANELHPDVRDKPPAPEPERVELADMPIPPVPVDGVCDLAANTQGCVSNIDTVGAFFDDATVAVAVTFGGADTSPFAGDQVIAVRVDGSTFANGTPWKCITCGIPAANRQGAGTSTDHPTPFHNGTRLYVGSTIVECGAGLLSDACTPEATYRYPIRWNVTPDGSGNGGNMRELRISPDGTHLLWNSFTVGTRLDQFTYIGRLAFNPAPATGNPAVPRFDLENVYRLLRDDQPPWRLNPDDPGELLWNEVTPEVGESRGWSWDGEWITYVGYPTSSSWIDMFMVHLETGEVRQLTREPEYADPADLSPDGQWGVYLDTRGSGRQMFVAGMPGIPPLTDLVSSSFVSSVRNEGQRRFFQPILIDIHADRGTYVGQNLKDPANTDSCPGGATPGSLCDPEWNARADPHWSPDGTAVVYRDQNSVGAAHADGSGRESRAVIARLVEREPQIYTPPAPTPDEVPWGEPYVPGSPPPFRSTLLPPAGTYTVNGSVNGSAEVTITHFTAGPTPVVEEVSVSYQDFSNDGINVINGTERVTRLPRSTPTMPHLEWASDLTLTGCQNGTKRTVGPDGTAGGPMRVAIDLFQTILYSEGELITTLDGTEYLKPPMSANHRPYSDL